VPDFAQGIQIPRGRKQVLEIFFAGVIGQDKGVGILIEALSKLNEITPDWNCVLSGDGAIKFYEELASNKGISSKVTFTGWVPPERIHAFMASADVVVLPSRGEGLPLSLIEGACAGAALIATDVGAVRDVLVESVNGIIVDPEPLGIALALARLVNDRNELRRFQSGSRQVYLARFTVEEMAARLFCIYREITQRVD